MPIAVGRGVCIDGVVARPELNGKLGTVESNDRSRGRCGMLVDGQLVSLRLACLIPEDSPPWECCRHGGPAVPPAVMETISAFIETTNRIAAPCLEHVRLFEPALRRMTSPIPPIILASMGVDAYMDAEYGHCRGFAVSAIVMDATLQVGVDQLFSQIAAGARARSAVVEQLVARLAKCTSAAGLFDVLGLFATCQCLKTARARGVGLQQTNIDPTPSPVDTIWGGGELPTADPSSSVLAPSESARVAGERIGRLALALLDPACTGALRARTLALRRAATAVFALQQPARGEVDSRATTRENMLVAMQAEAVAGMAFVEGGGVARLESFLVRGLVTLRRGVGLSVDEELLAALEVITSVGSSSLANALLEGRAARFVCQLADAARGNYVVAHSMMSALWSILRHASPSEYSVALGVALLRPVVAVAAHFLYDTLNEDTGGGAARVPPSKAHIRLPTLRVP